MTTEEFKTFVENVVIPAISTFPATAEKSTFVSWALNYDFDLPEPLIKCKLDETGSQSLRVFFAPLGNHRIEKKYPQLIISCNASGQLKIYDQRRKNNAPNELWTGENANQLNETYLHGFFTNQINNQLF